MDWAASAALLPLSWAYELGWRAYAAVYQLGFKRRRRFDLPILGIGNLEVGGLGKTPAAIEVARLLSAKNVAISSTAYGSPSSKGATWSPAREALKAEEHGDEPCLIRRKVPNVPLILGRDRVRAAELALEHGVEALILDDGFQHLPLARTADILLWDCSRRNWRLLPAGPLREPRSGAKRASAAFVEEGRPCIEDNLEFVQEAGIRARFAFRRTVRGLIELASGRKTAIQELEGKKIAALCAIGRPEGFFRTLRNLSISVEKEIALPDHHPINVKMEDEYAWIVTEKDATKLVARENVYALETEIEFCEPEAVADWLNKTLFR